MIPGIEQFYQRIADAMVGEIPEEWISATYMATFFPGSSMYEAEYVGKRDGKARSLSPEDDGDRAFRELRKLFKEAGKHPWGRAVFTILPSGKFDMKFDYDHCDEQGNAIHDSEEQMRLSMARADRLNAE